MTHENNQYKCGCHTYSVLCIVWATIGPGCSVVYMGHMIPYDARNASSDRMAETGSIHPASGFKTAFDLDLLSRGQVMLCQRFNAHIFD